MALRPVLPSVFGEGGVAYQSSPSLHYDNQYAEIGKSISNMGKALGGIANQQFQKQEQLNQEKETLALNKAMSDYDSVVAKGSEGLFQREGFSAGGISEEFLKMSRDASELLMESLREYSPETTERFRLHVQGRETSYTPRVSRFEHSQIQQATIALKQNLIAGDSKMYAETGDETQLGEIDRNFTEMWEKSGRRLVTPEKLDSYDKAAAAGVFFINGEKLKITEGDESTPGTISKARVADLRKRLEQDQIAFLEGRQDVFDAAHAARLEAYLEKGQITAAVKYLEYNPGENIGRGMSDEALTVLKAKVNRHAEAQSITETASTLALQVLSDGLKADVNNRSLGGRYNTPDLLSAELDGEKQIMDWMDKAPPDERPRFQKMLDAYRREIASRRSLRDDREKADLAKTYQGFRDEGLYLPGNEAKLVNRISTLPDSPVRDALMEPAAKRLYAVQQKAKEESERLAAEKERKTEALTRAARSTPENKDHELAVLTEMKRRMSMNEPYNGYDLNTREGRIDAVNSAGLLPEASVQLERYASNRRVPINIMAGALATSLNDLNKFKADEEDNEVYFTAGNVTAVAPGIMREVEEIAKLDPETDYTTKDGQRKLVGLVRDVLILHQKTEKGFLYGLRNVSAPEFFAKAIDAQGNVVDTRYTQEEFDKMAMTPAQYRRYRRGIEGIKARYLERPMSTVDMGEIGYSEAAQRQGWEMDEVRGKSVLVPGKAAREKREAEAKAKDVEEKLNSYRGKDRPRNRTPEIEATLQTFQMMQIPF